MKRIEELSNSLWLATQARTYRSVARHAFARLRRSVSAVTGVTLSPEDTDRQATLVCSQLAMDARDAFKRIFPDSEYRSCRDENQVVFEQAQERVAKCPQKMGWAGELDLIYSLTLAIKPEETLETGVAYGWSSLAILLAGSHYGMRKLTSTNLHYLKFGYDESFVGCAVPSELHSTWQIIRKPDRVALPEAMGEISKVGFAHYDSAKGYFDRMWSYSLLWNALESGGVLMSDDVGDNLAFLNFASKVGVEPTLVRVPQADDSIKYAGLIKK